MSSKSLVDRVAEIREKREKIRKKLEQYDNQVKRLEKQAAEEERKQRTHNLIVCGAELAALFGRVLQKDEVLTVVNFLREQQQLGNFTLEKPQGSVLDGSQNITAEEGLGESNWQQDVFDF